MSSYHRRQFVIAAAALAATAPFAPALALRSRFRLGGALEQGGLVIGTAESVVRVEVDGQAVSVSPQGVFVFGFAFDQKTSAHVRVAYSDGDIETRDVAPKARHYEVQSITGLPPKLVSPSPEDQARIDREHALVAEARKADTDATWFAEPFDWPAHGPISSPFGAQRELNGIRQAPHYGVDIAAPAGSIIRAPANGKVLIAQEFLLEGNFTLLDHGHGVFTSYMHQSRQLVEPGDLVERGQEIGRVGQTGRATGPHLHWGMNWFQVRLDPSLSARSAIPSRS